LDTEKTLQRAQRNAYALLRVRPRSEQELRSRLTDKGFAGPVVDRVTSDLKKRGEIDDVKFTRFWIRSRTNFKPVGDVILRHELRTKGISDSIIEATLAAEDISFNEYEVAKKMAEERLKRLQRLDSRKALKRLYDFLTRRGFKFDVIHRIIEELRAEL